MGPEENRSEKSKAEQNATGRKAINGILTAQAAYLIVIIAIGISRNIFPTPELIFIAVAGVMLWQADTRKFVIALLPFMLLLTSYSLLRAYADDISPTHVHYVEMIRWDRAIFGGMIPTVVLNQWLRQTSLFYVVLPLANMFYMTHFVGPFVVAVVLWQRAREHYWRFLGGLLLLSYAGFLTFLLFPAAPPWMAAMHGFLPRGVASLTYGRVFTLMERASPNIVAAMPSLHSAYPVYMVLYIWHVFGRRVWPSIFLPIGVWLSTLLLAQHYVVDLLAGAVYAVVAFYLATRFRRHQATEKVESLDESPALEPITAASDD